TFSHLLNIGAGSLLLRNQVLAKQDPIVRIANSITDVSLRTFNDRLRFQKIGYLAQELGADSGFTFDWYLNGPYSPSLTRMLYSANDLGTLRNPEVELTSEELLVTSRLRDLVGNKFED